MIAFSSPEEVLARFAREVPLDAVPSAGDLANDPAIALRPALRCDTLEDFAALALRPREFVLAPVLPAQALGMIYAPRGVGKTHVALGLAYAVARGGEFLRWRAPRPRPVLYLDGEMPAIEFQARLRGLLDGPGPAPPPGGFRVIAFDRQGLGTSLNLAREEDRARVEAVAVEMGAELLVLDNLSTLLAGGDENDAASWTEMQGWLLGLRRRGVTVLLIHHAGRNGLARGTSKREDALDTVLALRHPADYDAEQGARFEVHLTKGRGVTGEDAAPFEARLTIAEGVPSWGVTPLRDRDLDQVEELTRGGMTVRDIGEELDLSKSKVSRMQGRLRAEGRLP